MSRTPQNGLSEVSGNTDEPLLDLSVAGVLKATTARLPDHEAALFTSTGERWNYAQFAAKVDALAHAFRLLGLTKGQRIGIWSPNRPEWLLTQFASARAGLILVTINPAFRASEFEHALNSVGCAALVMASRFRSSDYIGTLRRIAPDMASGTAGALHLQRLPELRIVIETDEGAGPGTLAFCDVLDSGADADVAALDALEESMATDDPTNIQFTSGTTGLPKGATLSHRNIVNNARFVTAAMQFSEVDRLCIPVPFYHCFGMVMGTLGSVVHGATMVIPGEGFDPVATLAAVADERCTALFGVPTMFVAMLDSADRYDLSSLRTGIMAGSPCPIETMKRVQRDMHMSGVTIAYGMTETSPVSFQSDIDDPLDKRVSSVGRVHPHVTCRIVDAQGAIVPVGTQGELLTRGYSIMQGYWGEPARTSAVIDDEGWMHTGDLATLDAAGYCNITGRSKDMIVRGGENVYPREIEEFLYRMPGVRQVQVFGVPDERYGEIVCAWLIAEPGTQVPTLASVRAFCDGQIAHFKVPALVRCVDELPMTVTGKAQKFLMRRAMAAELGLSESVTA